MSAASVIFLLAFAAAVWWFTRNVRRIRRNILLGRDIDRTDRPKERWALMAKVALGQSKMVVRPVAGILHILVYAGFIIINIEVLEIIIDGIFGTHRVFSFLGGFYDFLIGSFEVLAVLTWLGCAIFLARRFIVRIPRFWSREMTLWPRTDAGLILTFEILLMTAFLLMNAADHTLQGMGVGHYVIAGAFPVSGLLADWFGFANLEPATLIGIERSCWWFHIIGILGFLNYLPYSKHFHILLAFPNVWYSKLEPKTRMSDMPRITAEVKSMLDPALPPPPPPAAPAPGMPPEHFGAKDVFDLTWKSLMDAYTCTECGRCTSVCPANITGKLLSPRKIVMDTRDRLQEVGQVIDKKGKWEDDGKDLFSRISEEELWACTTCNACTQACPVNIDPVEIILEMRRYLVMEQSKPSPSLNAMFTTIENNGAAWAFGPDQRMKWSEE
ncbi:MAG TPA: (Fe-S)-binding protein [Flavobacteriales bacterium]|nr:(Fe-S)-binding protein [Flavobacteriales bacterium]HRP82796.1 (Fe-S)-binding protein [Flavobacteriales bacterium]HRQ83802.1 (Fe-S)-binding protein [Flavobacteriales bacterium]